MLFRASAHHFSSYTFHSLCDNKGKTLKLSQQDAKEIHKMGFREKVFKDSMLLSFESSSWWVDRSMISYNAHLPDRIAIEEPNIFVLDHLRKHCNLRWVEKQENQGHAMVSWWPRNAWT